MIWNKRGTSFGAIVGIIGSILIFLGFAWLISQNWHQIPSPLKILILLGATSISFTTGTILHKKKYPKIGKALVGLGSLLYTLSIFLIAQILFAPGGWQGIAWLWFISLVGVLVAAYLFESSLSLIIGLIEIVIWLIAQYFAFSEMGGITSLGILAFYFLILGIILYGLNLLHIQKKHAFAKVYRWWTAFYFLLFTYILSFQLFLPLIWPKEADSPTSSFLFLALLIGIALATTAAGIRTTLKNKKRNFKEIIGFCGIVLLLLILIGSTSLVSETAGTCQIKMCNQAANQNNCEALPPYLNCQWNDNLCEDKSCYTFSSRSDCQQQTYCKWENDYCNQKTSCGEYLYEKPCVNSDLNCAWTGDYCYNKDLCVEHTTYESCTGQQTCTWYSGWFFSNLFGGGNYPLSLWAVWIVINLFFIALIIGIIGYGTWQKNTSLINLAIVFFALNIFTRYIGFIFDFRGYMGLSVIFITGGIVLLGGGYLVEKWRKKLITKAK